jgi:RNA polymerase sigma factor (sigma-70 family)
MDSPLTEKEISTEKVWDLLEDEVIEAIKKFLIKNHPQEILEKFQAQISSLISSYSAHLPRHVVSSEADDLANIAKVEFLESIKAWDPRKNKEIWPLAYQRISGAMRDHIRHLTKADPSRLYDWITNAAYLYITMADTTRFENKVETGFQLKDAMEKLNDQEKKIVVEYYNKSKTFKQIGEELKISESQVSRLCKTATEKMRRILK